ncbi:hypothetical protein [Adhaeribacter aerolatus]|nr:hypothetical protein [Adhaeribacter aerolatus]
MMKIGILNYQEQETLWQIAKQCAKTNGVAIALPTTIAGASRGSVSVRGVGAVPGQVAETLAYLVSGSVLGLTPNALFRAQLRLLVNGYNSAQAAAAGEKFNLPNLAVKAAPLPVAPKKNYLEMAFFYLKEKALKLFSPGG